MDSKYLSNAMMSVEEVDKIERMLKWISIAALVVGGAVFIYEGVRYKKLKDDNDDLPNKMYGAATAALVLGILSVIFGIVHIWW